jgi:predicted phosphodiesterase
MKVVITSDTHFGDLTSELAKIGPNGQPALGSRYEDFAREAGADNDYLILLGDIVDVAIQNYKEAFDIFKYFLNRVAEDKLAKKIIYVPGNHDFDVWHAVEYQANIINRISSRPQRPTSLFRMSVPAFIDDRDPKTFELFLGGVTRGQDPDEPYGHHLFLDYLTDQDLNISVAFPNVYLITRDETTILLTHGQYFQVFWSILSDWAPRVLGSDLRISVPPLIKILTHLNFPLSQLSSSGVGQAGPLTNVIREIQYDFKSQRTEKIEIYLDNLLREVRSSYLKKTDLLTRLAFWFLKKKVIKEIKKKPHLAPKEDKGWETRQETLKKMTAYYLSSCDEIRELNDQNNLNYPCKPQMLIFGHSHRPIGITNGSHPSLLPFSGGPHVPVYNTGGWLQKDPTDKSTFSGIELFIYETGKAIRSVKID